MCKTLWSIATVGVFTFVAAHCQAQVRQALPPGYGSPPQGYAQLGYGYPQASPLVPGYPPSPWRSYYNDPQWQQDWRDYMQRKSTGIPTPEYIPGTLPRPGSPNYRPYFSDPEWQQDWTEYMRRKSSR